MPIAHQCTVCLRSAPDVTIVDCPDSEAHGPGLSGRCEECLRTSWLGNRAPYNINGDRAAGIEKARYYNNAALACQFCAYQGVTRRLSGACADYHHSFCARWTDDPDHLGPCTKTCTKTTFGDKVCRFHDNHGRLCEPVTDFNHVHVPPECVIGKRPRR